MKFKDPENKKYFMIGLTAVITISILMLVALLIFKVEVVMTAMRGVLKVIKPFIVGAAVAYLLAPVCNWIEEKLIKVMGEKKKGIVEAIAIVLSILFGLAIIFGLLLLVIPQVARSIVSLAGDVPELLEKGNNVVNKLLTDQPDILVYWTDAYDKVSTKLETWMQSDLLPKATKMLSELAVTVSDVLSTLKDVFLGLILSIYMLGARKQFAAQGKLILHGIFKDKWAGIIEEEIKYTDKMFNGFFMGKIVDSAIVGVICFVGCLIMGFESAALIAVVVGVTNIIPFFGPYIGIVPCAILLLLENPKHCLFFIIFAIVLQLFDGNVLGPIILGDSTGLSGFWILFAILFFGGFWGLVGMIIGVPFFAVIYDIIRKLTYRGIRGHGHEKMIKDYNAVYHPPVEKKKLKLSFPKKK